VKKLNELLHDTQGLLVLGLACQNRRRAGQPLPNSDQRDSPEFGGHGASLTLGGGSENWDSPFSRARLSSYPDLAHGPRRCPSVDIARGPRVDILQTSLHGPKNNQNHFLRKKQWHWKDLNSSLLHGSLVPNQLDHKGHLEFCKVYSSLYIKFLKIKKWTSQGPHGDFLEVIRRGPCEDLPT
jgi:hypothetical protein